MKDQKRAVAISDISGLGKCSLTVALPVISAAGVETAVMPTALLSTHTGGLGECSSTDLTRAMEGFISHWKRLDVKFDAIFSGYLGSEKQVDIVSEFIDCFKQQGTVVLVDPAMGDNGRLYSGISAECAAKTAQLCSKADVIVPNITEAAFILGEEFRPAPYNKAYLEGLAARLAEKTGASVVLTGVDIGDGNSGALIFETKPCYAFAKKYGGHFHGTGDVFASALLGAYLNGHNLERAAEIAVWFTAECIDRTISCGRDSRFGLNFEQVLPSLANRLRAE